MNEEGYRIRQGDRENEVMQKNKIKMDNYNKKDDNEARETVSNNT